jgi:hypothetical protein
VTVAVSQAVRTAPRPVSFQCVLAWWGALLLVGELAAPILTVAWPPWRWAFAAAAMWGFNLLLLVYAIGPPFGLNRPPMLTAAFALFTTLFGSGSYWATIQLYPGYRVSIERAAWLVALCTAVSLATVALAGRTFVRHRSRVTRPSLEWDWARLRGATYLIFAVAAVGTAVTIGRIGHIPIVIGDPASERVTFPEIGGIWFRLSMLGGVAALLVTVQAAARRASLSQYVVGVASLMLVGLYGPRFPVALPLGVGALLWDRLRTPIRFGRAALLVALVAPSLALIGYWRQQDQNVALLNPVALLLYGTVGEFRDLGWALDYYSVNDRLLHGGTLGSVVVPLLPSPVWTAVGIDKAAIYAHSSASILAGAMGQTVAGERVGLYGEFFMNFGWAGALIGAVLYGALLAYLDNRYGRVSNAQVRGVFLALTIAAATFALIGQLDMFTSTLTSYGYPLGLVVLLAAGRPKGRSVTT